MVRSLDMQQILLQSNAVERIQQVQQQHPNVQQQYFGDQLNKQQSLLKEKVKHLEESERLMIREEDRQHKEKKHHGDRKQNARKEDTSDVTNDLSVDEFGVKVDIKV